MAAKAPKKSARAGRPPKPEEERKEVNVMVRVSVATRERFAAGRKRDRFAHLGPWLERCGHLRCDDLGVPEAKTPVRPATKRTPSK